MALAYYQKCIHLKARQQNGQITPLRDVLTLVVDKLALYSDALASRTTRITGVTDAAKLRTTILGCAVYSHNL